MTDDTPAPIHSHSDSNSTPIQAPAAPAPAVDEIMRLAAEYAANYMDRYGACESAHAALRAAVEHVCGMSKSWEGWAWHYKEHAERAERERDEEVEHRRFLLKTCSELEERAERAEDAWNAAIEHANHMTGELEKAERENAELREIVDVVRNLPVGPNGFCSYPLTDLFARIDAFLGARGGPDR